MKYSFNVVSPVVNGKYTSLTGLRNSIFLAGPCPRKDYSKDWRFEAFDILNKLGFAGNVITPTNPEYHNYATATKLNHDEIRAKQVSWERAAMHVASVIVFWVPRDKDHPALTTNIEFGEWYKKPSIVVGWPEYAEHNGYFACKLKEQKKSYCHTLEDTLTAAVNALSRNQTMYFTSDTHFRQQRTLELSRRPFSDVYEMDLTMVSNWNKTVTMNDIVYHAGDFIDPDHVNQLDSLLSTLNFKELHWTLGNYDRKVRNSIHKIVFKHMKLTGRPIHLYESGACMLKGPSGKTYVIVHEPNDFEYAVPDGAVVLFGHIHGRSFAKKNGFDLAADYHHYTPLSIEQVEWFANAMQYWDKNVYSSEVSVKS